MSLGRAIARNFVALLLIVAVTFGLVYGGIKLYKHLNDTNEDEQEEMEDDEEQEEDEDDDEEEENSALEVRVIEADLDEDTDNGPITFEKTGVVVDQGEVEIFPEVSANIEELHVAEGTQVKKGNLLATFGSSSQINTARANYNSAIAQINNVQQIIYLTQRSTNISESTLITQLRATEHGLRSALDNLATTKYLRYQNYLLEDSLAREQELLAEQSIQEEVVTKETDKLNHLQNFNENFKRWNQEIQGRMQDNQNFTQVVNAKSQIRQLIDQVKSTKVQGDIQVLNLYNQIEGIKQQLEAAKQSIEAGWVTSPIDGVVTKVNVNKGDRVGPNSSLIVVSGLDDIAVQVSLAPEEVFTLNQNTQVTLKAFDHEVPAKILSVGLSADPQTRTIPVKVTPLENPNKPLIPNTFAGVTFKSTPDPNSALANFTLPVNLLKFDNDKIFVAVVENNKVVYKEITLAPPVKDGYAGIQSGLNNGDKIIISQAKLPEGTEVTITN